MSHLELRIESGGPRFYVEGEPLHAGDGLEVWFPDLRRWVKGRYEYQWYGAQPPKAIKPFFYYRRSGDARAECMELGDDWNVRLPERA